VFATKHLSINSTVTRKSIAFLGTTVVDGNSSEEVPKEVLIVSQVLFSGGRPEGSKCNLKFQSAMWHHFEHFQSNFFFFLVVFLSQHLNYFVIIIWKILNYIRSKNINTFHNIGH